MITQVGDLDRRLPRSNDVGVQRLTGRTLTDHNRGARHVITIDEGTGDLRRFDAEPADLDLIVRAPQVLQRPIGLTPHQVAGAVHPFARPPRVGDERRGRQIRPSLVAPAHSGTAEIQLARHAVQHRGERPVEQQCHRVEDRLADIRAVTVGEIRAERIDRVFRWAVEVVRPQTGSLTQRRPQRLRDRLSSEREERDAVVTGFGMGEQAGFDQQFTVGGRDVESVDAVLCVVGQQRSRIFAHALTDDVHRMSVQQPEQLLPRGIERERRGVRDLHRRAAPAFGGRTEDALDVVVEHVDQSAVRDRNTFRRTGGTRRVDDVRQAGWIDSALHRLRHRCIGHGQGLTHEQQFGRGLGKG